MLEFASRMSTSGALMGNFDQTERLSRHHQHADDHRDGKPTDPADDET